jgi:negative regulator of genetic competence, sporulation and motility
MEDFGEPIIEAYIERNEISSPLNKARGRYFVYILLKNEVVVYVGRTKNLLSRLQNHKYIKDFDRVFLMEYPDKDQLYKYEKVCISYYMPEYNRRKSTKYLNS